MDDKAYTRWMFKIVLFTAAAKFVELRLKRLNEVQTKPVVRKTPR